LGCGGHLSALRRTATHAFRVEQAVTIEQFEAMSRTEIAERLISVRDAVPPGFAL
jgi:tRNA pseudouridine55 synthase